MKFLFVLVGFIFAFTFPLNNDFLEEQKKYERVRTAISEKQADIQKKLNENGVQLNNIHVLMVAYKSEALLELYVKKKDDTYYKKLMVYNICASSGVLGPKRKQGDSQVPEGFYHIDRFNPVSSFYLSLGINYPNLSDKKKSTASNLGGDIFIHGWCVTIGCMPMTDEKIKEIYLYAVHAKNNGQTKIPVYVFPFKMNNSNFTAFKAKYAENKSLISFWSNLKAGYDQFEQEHKELVFSIGVNGDYIF